MQLSLSSESRTLALTDCLSLENLDCPLSHGLDVDAGMKSFNTGSWLSMPIRERLFRLSQTLMN
jgi:hypothetical protein